MFSGSDPIIPMSVGSQLSIGLAAPAFMLSFNDTRQAWAGAAGEALVEADEISDRILRAYASTFAVEAHSTIPVDGDWRSRDAKML